MSAATATVSLSIVAQDILASGIRAGVIPLTFRSLLDLRNGTTDGKIDTVFAKSESSKAASGTTNYDLAGGVTDTYGATLTFAEVVLIALKNKRTTAQATLTIGPSASNGFGTLATGRGIWVAALGSGGGTVVHPSHATRGDLESWFVWHAPDGVPVTASTGDVLSVVTSAVSGDTNAWDILILGRSS